MYILVLNCHHELPCIFIRKYPQVAFYKGDERTRSFSVTTVNQNDQSTVTYEFTSSGTTTDYESFELNSDSTYRLYVTPTGDNYYDWLSITEVGARNVAE